MLRAEQETEHGVPLPGLHIAQSLALGSLSHPTFPLAGDKSVGRQAPG